MKRFLNPETGLVERPLPVGEGPKAPRKPEYKNGAEVSAWFEYGIGHRDIVTIGTISESVWVRGSENFLYTLEGCSNQSDGRYVAWEYEIAPVEEGDRKALAKLQGIEDNLIPEMARNERGWE
jgi:hypothetical protein